MDGLVFEHSDGVLGFGCIVDGGYTLLVYSELLICCIELYS